MIEQKKQIEKHHASAAFRSNCEPAVMAEPEHAGDDEADHQCDDRLRINAHQVVPARRLGEAGGLWQIIGEQRHGNAEDGVAQHFQPAHFEKTDLRQYDPPSPSPSSLSLCSSYAGHAPTWRSSRGCATRSPSAFHASPVRLRFRCAQATPDTPRPDGLGVAAPRVARQGEAWCGRWDSNPHGLAIEGF